MDKINDKKSAFDRPLGCDDVEWVVTSVGKTGKMLVSPYVTAQTVMTLFDAKFGALGWQDSYRSVPPSGASTLAHKGANASENVYEAAPGGVICTLKVRNEETGEWITREDGAPEDGEFPVKAAISNALKRAAVKFGLGRELSTYPKVFIETGDRFIPNWAEAKLCNVVEQFNAGKLAGRAVLVIKESDQAPAPKPVAATAPKQAVAAPAPVSAPPVGKTPEQLKKLLEAEMGSWSAARLKESGSSHFRTRAEQLGFTEEQCQEVGALMNTIYKAKLAKETAAQPATA